jgi:hypothetical protein
LASRLECCNKLIRDGYPSKKVLELAQIHKTTRGIVKNLKIPEKNHTNQ